MRTLIVMAAVLLLSPAAASAQAARLDLLNRDGRVARLSFDLLDYNSDNQIDLIEWYGSAALFERLDANRNGYLTRSELAKADIASAVAAHAGVSRTRTFVVTSRQRWLDTGIDIRIGDVVSVVAGGSVSVTGRSDGIADPYGAFVWPATGRTISPHGMFGGLIARVGNVEPFVVGSQFQSMEFTYAGRLYLGVNDEWLIDNTGQFRASVTVTRR